MRGTASIIGIGETPVGEMPECSALDLMEQAAVLAIADAGVTKDAIDGVLTSRMVITPLHRVAVILSERLGIVPRHFATLEAGGATALQLLSRAAMAIHSGMASYILCVAADNLRTGMTRDRAIETMAQNAHPEFEVPVGTFPAAAYAMIARAHMSRYGTTAYELADVAVSARAWAQHNPSAQHREPLSHEEVLGARRIAEPFGTRDCALVSDGGAAFIVSKATNGGGGVAILGYGECAGHEYLTRSPELTTFASVQSGAAAFAMADVVPTDIDIAEIYDCFTITPIVVVEDLGFCNKGEGGRVPNGAHPPRRAIPHEHPRWAAIACPSRKTRWYLSRVRSRPAAARSGRTTSGSRSNACPCPWRRRHVLCARNSHPGGTTMTPIVLHRCTSCAQSHYMAPQRCPACLSPSLEPVEAGGEGIVASYTVIHRAPNPALAAAVPYALLLVDLAEGARIMARAEVSPRLLAVGARVQVEAIDGIAYAKPRS